ncbi:MAG: hypothetical protein WEA09_01010 [Gemmatimonadota bacterium]
MACGQAPSPSPEVLEEQREVEALRELLGLERSVPLHGVVLGDESGGDDPQPALTEVDSESVVHFLSQDHRARWIRFIPDSLSPVALRFLEERGQLTSPPLVAPGSRFVVTFQGAPPGLYPYEVQSHGAAVQGAVRVLPFPDA